jgi:chaperonin GroES
MFTPLFNNVLIKRFDGEREVGGIHLPESAVEKPSKGEVIAVGEVEFVKVNDIVLFGKYAGTEIEYDGVEYLIMKEEEILGFV